MSKEYIGQSAACRRAGAWIIQNHESGAIVGKIIAAYPEDGAGRLRLTLWDWTDEANYQTFDGSASGYGYNKVASVLSRMTFGGVSIREGDWEKSLRDAGYDTMQIL